jgi:DNA-binding NtrC family response regulator
MSNDTANSPNPIPIRQSKHVLVVEDDVGLRFILAEWLRSLTYIVYEAANADEAVILLASSIPVDLVVTDVDMPGTMNGFGLVDHIRQYSPGLNIIVVSGKAAGLEAKERSVPFFRKPYDLEAVAVLIETLIQTNTSEPCDE